MELLQFPYFVSSFPAILLTVAGRDFGHFRGAPSSVHGRLYRSQAPHPSPPKSFGQPRESNPRLRGHVGRRKVGSPVPGRLRQI